MNRSYKGSIWKFTNKHITVTSHGVSERALATASHGAGGGGGGGYQSIGSFHNENLADMLAQDDETYQPPPLPFDGARASTPTSGEGDDFSLDLDAWTFLNHGAFGAALRVGQRRADDWRRYLEAQPLRYHDRALLPHLAHAARSMARLLVGPDLMMSPSSSYALLPNVTSGMNAVLQNYTQRYGKEGHIIFWDSTYGSVKTMARHYGKHGRVTEIPLLAKYLVPLVMESSSSASILAQALMQHTTPQESNAPPPLLLLEQTTSNTALNFPVAALAQAARTHLHPDTLVVVDGAHGLWAHDTAQILNDANNGKENDHHDDHSLSSSVDVYLANGHKWLAAPRGVALAWSRNETTTEQLLQYPAIVSHGMHASDLFSRFVWDGCRDYNAALAIPAVLDYWNTRMEDGTSSRLLCDRKSVRQQLWQGLTLLANQWHGMPEDVNTLQNDGFARGLLLAPYHQGWLDTPMALLRLPPHLEGAHSGSTDAKRVQDFLYDNNVEVPIKCVEGKLYVRVSCHIYNQQKDFQRLASVLKE